MTSERGQIALGPMTFTVVDGVLRHLCWQGVEVVRGLSAPIRDTAWGTLEQRDATEETREGLGRWLYLRRCTVADGAIVVSLEFEVAQTGRLTAQLALQVQRDIEVNRAGFTLLHPLHGVTGQDGTAIGMDGARRPFVFPERISPAQPVGDLAGLVHDVLGVRVEIDFEGETFEMEDQRNWSDASFKTYCRPLALPLPQRLMAGDRIEQRITLRLSGKPPAAASHIAADAGIEVRMPEILLAVRPGWLPVTATWPGGGALLRMGHDHDWTDVVLARIAVLLPDRAPDLEVVLPADSDPRAALDAVAARLVAHGLRPRHVTALPAPYLRSIQPEGPWPEGRTPEDAVAAACAAFPEARIGAGMLTNFTELNRRPVAGGDFITHGNAAVVHAADDRSVLETLETLPQILQSGRHIAGGRGYRLGLVAIAMASNPYGEGLAPNLDGRRMTMTDVDPRQATEFSAAYAVAVAAIAARAGVEAIALAAPTGPFGVTGPEGTRPVAAAIRALASLSGLKVRIVGKAPGPLMINAGDRRIALAGGGAAPTYRGFDDARGRNR